MRNLSWNLQLVLGLLALAIIFAIGFGVFYTVVRLDRDKPMDFEVYPGAQLYVEEKISEKADHFYYYATDSAENIERFYQERGYICLRQGGRVYEAGIAVEVNFIKSVCLVDRSHSLGFIQFNQLTIWPERSAYVYEGNNPQNAIVGGGELTGKVVIDIQRQWGGGLLGG